MDNVRAAAQDPAYGNATPGGRWPKGGQNNAKLKLIAGLVAGLIALVAVVLLVVFLYRSSTAANIDSSKYQAVFFTNGQVYFGKLQSLNGGYLKLTGVFYLQAKEQAASAEDQNNPQKTTTDTSQDVELIKLGDEIHGPRDEMIISREQVLFFENLKSEGKISSSIDQYLKQKK